MAAIKWLNAVSGDWATGGLWSSGSAPTAADDVTIDRRAALQHRYTIQVTGAQAAHSVTLAAGPATLIVNGALSVAGSFVLNAGRLDLEGTLSVGGTLSLNGGRFDLNGTLADATVVAGATRTLSTGGTLQNVQWQGVLSMAATGFNSSTLTLDGARFSGAGGVGAGLINVSNYGTLRVNQASLDNVTVVLPKQPKGVIVDNPGGTVSFGAQSTYLGPQFTLQAGYRSAIVSNGTVTNAGTIDVDGRGPSAALTISAASFVNTGLITVTQAVMNVAAGFSNLGVLDLGAGGTLALGAGLAIGVNRASVSGLGSLQLAATSRISLGAGSSLTGLYTAASPNIVVDGGTLGALRWQGTLTLQSGSGATFAGVRFEGPGGIGRGALAVTASQTVDVRQSSLDNVAVTIGSARLTLTADYAAAGGTLTFGPKFSLALGAGTAFSGAGLTIGEGAQTGTVVNQGTLTLNGYVAERATSFVNAGVIQLGGTGTLSVGATFANAGTIAVGGGATLDAGGQRDGVGAVTSAFANSGTVSVAAGGTLLAGSGAVLDLATGALGGYGNVSLATGAVLGLGFGASATGTRASGGIVPIFRGGTLTNAVWRGAWNQANGYLTLAGATFTGNNGSGSGAISTSRAGLSLTLAQKTLDNLTFTSNGPDSISGGFAEAPPTVTLGRNFALTVNGSFGLFNGPYWAPGTILNAGSIAVTATGTLRAVANLVNAGSFSVNGGRVTLAGFSNTGTASFGAGSVVINGNISNTGTISVGSGVQFSVGGALTIAGSSILELGRISFATGVTLDIGPSGSLTGTRSADATLPLTFSGGTLTNLTWQGPLALAAGSTLTLNGLTATGAGGTGPGTISGTYAVIRVQQSVLDNAAVTLTGGSFYAGQPPGFTLTLGTHLSLSVQAGQTYFGEQYYDDRVVVRNEGTLSLTGTLNAYATGFINAGTLRIDGGLLRYNHDTRVPYGFSNAGTVSVAHGSLQVGDLNAANAFVNTGLVSIGDGGTLICLNQSFTLSDGLLPGYEAAPTGTVLLAGASTLSGTRTSASPNFRFTGGTLSNATWRGSLTLGNIDSATPEFLTLRNVTFTGEDGTGPGTITLTQSLPAGSFVRPVLTVAQPVLDNVTVTLIGAASVQSIRLDTVAAGGTVTLGSGATIIGKTDVGIGGTGGSVVNNGTVTAVSGLFYILADAVINNGTILATGSYIDIGKVFTNSGSVTALSGTVSISVSSVPGSSVSNLNAGTLTGGSWTAGPGGTIKLPFAATNPAFADNATIVLDGAGSMFSLVDTASGTISLESRLNFIGGAGTLAVLGGRDYASTLSIVNDGMLRIGGGTFAAGGLTIGASGALSGFGTITAPIVNIGAIEAAGGTLTLAGGVLGAGAISVDDGAALRVGAVGARQVVTLDGASTLDLTALPDFQGALAGLSAGDALDLAGVSVTAARLTDGALRLTLADGTHDAIRLAAPAPGLHLTLGSDGAGGTTISFG